MLHDVEIDWGWSQLTEAERAIARRHQARLVADRQAHTVETATAALVAAGAELRGRTLRMRAVDDERTYGWELVEGELRDDGGAFDADGMFPGELTADDFRDAGVTLVKTPLPLPEAMLWRMRVVASDSLSALVTDAWQAAADELPAGFRQPAGPRRMQSVYLPVDVWEDIHTRAKAEECSPAYLVQRAVTAAYNLPVQ